MTRPRWKAIAHQAAGDAARLVYMADQMLAAFDALVTLPEASDERRAQFHRFVGRLEQFRVEKEAVDERQRATWEPDGSA